jgi:hypothetical protein
MTLKNELESPEVNDNEKFYDEHIAPALRELAKKCHEKGMPFLAMVGNGSDNFNTKFIKQWENPTVRMTFYAMQADGNIDRFLMMMENDFKKYGGVENSCYMSNLEHYRKIIRAGQF